MKNLIKRVLENVAEEMTSHFEERTNKHISLVQGAAKKIADHKPAFSEFDPLELIENVSVHDDSKFKEPERTPYISLTWRHKLEKEKGEYDPFNGKGYQTPGMLSKEDENEATLHHVLNNEHHPEFWLEDKSEANINSKDRNKSNKVVDASKMSALAIAEMVADWQAMSEELGTNTARQWYDKQKNVRWSFSEEQDKLIDKLLSVFEEDVVANESVKDLDDLIKIQKNDPIVKKGDKVGEYMRGLGNGLIVAKAVVKDEDFKDEDLIDIPRNISNESALKERSLVFPVVMKSPKIKQLHVVYKDHVEFYKYDGGDRSPNVSSDAPKQVFDPFVEVEMLKGNGFREIHAKESWLTEEE